LNKRRRIRWVRYLARRGKGHVYARFWWGNLGERVHLENPDVDGMIILKQTFRKWIERTWIGVM
jgi:hypothetical protein